MVGTMQSGPYFAFSFALTDSNQPSDPTAQLGLVSSQKHSPPLSPHPTPLLLSALPSDKQPCQCEPSLKNKLAPPSHTQSKCEVLEKHDAKVIDMRSFA